MVDGGVPGLANGEEKAYQAGIGQRVGGGFARHHSWTPIAVA